MFFYKTNLKSWFKKLKFKKSLKLYNYSMQCYKSWHNILTNLQMTSADEDMEESKP